MKNAAPWVAAVLIVAATMAQAQEEVAPADRAMPPADCRAVPADQPAGEGATLPQESKMEECGAVLKPPASADSEIAVQPEQGGETPVLPPSQVPHDEGEDNQGGAE